MILLTTVFYKERELLKQADEHFKCVFFYAIFEYQRIFNVTFIQMEIPKDPLPSSFEEWYNENSKYLPKEFDELLDSKQVKNNLSFIFAWKRYEQLTFPLLQALMVKQYPLVATADDSFEKHRHQNIEHRIFDTATFAWRIIQHNEKKEQPEQAVPGILKFAEKGLYDPSRKFTFYTEENPPEEWIKRYGKEKGWYFAEEINREQKAAVEYFNKLYYEIITTLQEHLLALFPKLLEMDAVWWKIYRFFLHEQCNSWKDKLDRMEDLVKHKLSGDWLDKPSKELRKELDRLYEIEWQEKYGDIEDL